MFSPIVSIEEDPFNGYQDGPSTQVVVSVAEFGLVSVKVGRIEKWPRHKADHHVSYALFGNSGDLITSTARSKALAIAELTAWLTADAITSIIERSKSEVR
jgi:hypothetical protein